MVKHLTWRSKADPHDEGDHTSVTTQQCEASLTLLQPLWDAG